MNAKPSHIKPVFAPETEFEVQALSIFSEDRSPEAHSDDPPPSLASVDYSTFELVDWNPSHFACLLH